MRLGGVCGLGEGGVGVLVGGGGRIGRSEYRGSANENSELSSSKAIEDSVVGDGGKDES